MLTDAGLGYSENHREPGPVANLLGVGAVDLTAVVRGLWGHTSVGMLLIRVDSADELVVVRATERAAALLGTTAGRLERPDWEAGLSEADRRCVWEGMHEVRSGRAPFWSSTLQNQAGGVAVDIAVTPLVGRASDKSELLVALLAERAGHDVVPAEGAEPLVAAAASSIADDHPSAELRRAGATLWAVVDEAGRVLSVNDETAHMLGRHPAAMQGRPMWEFVDAEFVRARLQAEFEAGLGTLGIAHWEFEPGASRSVLWTRSELQVDDAVLHVFTGLDLDQVVRSQAALRALDSSESSIGVIAVDRRGCIEHVNEAAGRMLHRDASSLHGQPLDSVVEIAAPGAAGRMPVEGGVAWRPQLVHLPGRDSQTVRGALVATSMRGGCDGRGVLVLVETEGGREDQDLWSVAVAERESTLGAAQALIKQKNDFCATAGHELRTPVTTILGFTEILLDGAVGDLDEHQRALMDAVHRSAVRLQGLVEDLMAVAAATVVAESPGSASVDVVVALVLGDLASQAQERRVTLVGPAGSTGLTVPVAPARLAEAARQVVTNALQFTPAGGVVQVEIDEHPQAAVLTVYDNGHGIPAADLPYIFEPFARSAVADRFAIQGAGLGLTIADKIVSDHGGRIVVSSVEGRGTQVTITLPTTQSSQTQPRAD